MTTDRAATLVPDADELAQVGGLASGNAVITPTTIGTAWDDAKSRYRTAGGEPAVRFFTLSDAPIERDAADYAFRGDPVLPLGTFTNGQGATVTQTTRIYTAEIFAGRHVGALRSPIKQCATFSYDGRDIELAPRDFATGNSVASAGWVEASADRERFVADLVYANVAMRISLEQPPG